MDPPYQDRGKLGNACVPLAAEITQCRSDIQNSVVKDAAVVAAGVVDGCTGGTAAKAYKLQPCLSSQQIGEGQAPQPAINPVLQTDLW